MKKALLSLSLLAAVAVGSFSFQSCNKIKDEIAKQIDPFNFTHQNINFTVPEITSTMTYTSSGIDTADIDLDQIIKENAGSSFGVNNIQSLVIDKITLTITNPDEHNNLTNFDSVQVYVNSDQGIQNGKNDIYAYAWVTDGAYDPNNQTLTITGDPNLQMMDYLKGNKVYYWFRARARRTTDKELMINMKIDYKVKVKL
jgi:hypothetical protein